YGCDPSGAGTCLYDGTPGLDNDRSGSAWSSYASGEYPMYPDASVFIHQSRGVGECDAIIAGLPSQFVRITKTVGASPAVDDPSIIDAWGRDDWADGAGAAAANQWRVVRRIAEPIPPQQMVYYVHPDNKLAQALYGKCVNRRPYFVSAGHDLFHGNPRDGSVTASALGLNAATNEEKQAVLKATRKNNIYSYPVDVEFDVDPTLLGTLWQ
ncbi:MAG TPA: hypothetical protein VG797_10215, partial [Phycisphaerales bacterium]|nr:hypothetical protein [Phycisphaerales bacterium]